MFPNKKVHVKKDPAHISDLIFRSFVGYYPHPDFQQEVKQKTKACFFRDDDIGNRPHKMPTNAKETIYRKLIQLEEWVDKTIKKEKLTQSLLKYSLQALAKN